MDKGLDAEASARASIGECRKKGDVSGELLALLSLGKILCVLKRHGEALGVYTKLARPLLTSPKSKEYEEYLSGVAECKYELDELDDALSLAARRCELAVELFGDKSAKVASAKKQIADVLFVREDYKDALAFYESAREFSDEKLMIDIFMSSTLVKLGKHERALTIRQRNVESAKTVYGEGHEMYAGTMHDLASSYAFYELYDFSVDCESKALAIRMVVLGPEHFDTVKSAENLEEYRRKNVRSCAVCKKPAAASKPCSRCEEFWYCSSECQLSHWNAEHKSVCLKHKLALKAVQLFLDEKYYVHAESRAAWAVRMYHKLKDREGEWGAWCLLAYAMRHRNKTEEELRVYETMVRPMTVKLYTERSKPYYSCTYSIVECLLKLKRFDEARALLDNQQTLVLEVHGEKSDEYYQVVCQFCNVLYHQNKYAEALPYFEKIIPLLPNSGTGYPTMLKRFVSILSRTGDYARALQTLHDFKSENADVSFGLSLIYGALGRFDRGIFYAEQALRIQKDERYEKCIAQCRQALTNKALTMQLAPEKRMCGVCDKIFDIFNVEYLCGLCQKVPYCCVECQLADWPEHKTICKPRCVHCWKEGDDLGWCSRCLGCCYCSAECQLADWHFDHKRFCKEPPA